MRLLSKVLDAVLVTDYLFIGLCAVCLLPGLMGYRLIYATGSSMEPAIHDGSLTCINMNEKDFQVGDVVAYRDFTEERVLHRIIKIDPDGLYVIKGDANEEADFFPVRPNQIEGKLVFAVPYLGYCFSNFKWLYFAVLIIVIVITFVQWKREPAGDLDEKENDGGGTVTEQ